jgi:protease-4
MIAVVYVDGDILEGSSGSLPLVGQVAGHRTLGQTLGELASSGRVRAIVLRIDSPGGSAWASESIWRATQQANEVLPVVVSMGDIAASGGYYIAAAGREIFATPLTLTGSIGIFAGHFATTDLFRFIGVNRFPIRLGANANLFGIEVPWTEEQHDAAFRDISLMYDTFLERVAAGRDSTPADIDPLARGRIWSGTRALDNGLIDRIGDLIDAIDRARLLAGLDPDTEVRIVQLPQRRMLEALGIPGVSAESGLTIEALTEIAAAAEILGLDNALRIPLLYGDGRPAARLEFDLEGLE